MNRRLIWSLVSILALAFLLRLPQLGARPMHADESVHAVKFMGLWEKGYYQYNPDEYHGPSLYYATWPVAFFHRLVSSPEVTEAVLRFVPLLFCVGLIVLLPLLKNAMGSIPILASALFITFSPAMVFYSRYFIHEMLLLFFTLALIASCWNYVKQPSFIWSLFAGVSLGLMHATKETFVFQIASMVIGFIGVWAWCRWIEKKPLSMPAGYRHSHLLACAGSGLIVSFLLFSSFFTNWNGPLDSILTYLPWINRAGGNTQHTHPWHYYLGLLLYCHRLNGPVWTEAIIVILAFYGGVMAFIRRPIKGMDIHWWQWIAIQTFFLTLLYSLIPYKTPWCLLGFLLGMILLAGFGVGSLFYYARNWTTRLIVTGLLIAAFSHLGWQSWRATHAYASSPKNPYVYAHTIEDLISLANRVKRLGSYYNEFQKSQSNASTKPLVIEVMAPGGDYWPLPWYLRQLDGRFIGWRATVPTNICAEIVIASPKFASAKTGPSLEQLHDTHVMTQFYGYRPTLFFQLYVEKHLWDFFLSKGGGDDD